MTDESREDVYVHSIWKWGTSALFDVQIVNLDAGSYLRQMSANTLETVEREKIDKFLQPCLVRRNSFIPMVYSVVEITDVEVVTAQRSLALLLSNQLKQDYLEMCDFVTAHMSLVTVRSNTLLLQGTRNKEAYIRQ